MADPGFPVGGVWTRWGGGGGVGLRHGWFLAKMYAKTKEFGPVGGGGVHPARPLDPPMLILQNANSIKTVTSFQTILFPS